jgi:hypothetical protein
MCERIHSACMYRAHLAASQRLDQGDHSSHPLSALSSRCSHAVLTLFSHRSHSLPPALCAPALHCSHIVLTPLSLSSPCTVCPRFALFSHCSHDALTLFPLHCVPPPCRFDQRLTQGGADSEASGSFVITYFELTLLLRQFALIVMGRILFARRWTSLKLIMHVYRTLEIFIVAFFVLPG